MSTNRTPGDRRNVPSPIGSKRRGTRFLKVVCEVSKGFLSTRLSAQQVRRADLAGEKIQTILTRAPGNGAPIGGLKVVAESGWFAARPSGTENIYKIYAESFRGENHLRRILEEAQTIVNEALEAATSQDKSTA